SGNLMLSALGIADLTGIEAFPNVQTLSIRNNQLTNIDVSQNTAMIALYCDNNQLTSLSVTANINLTELDAANNQIGSLDVSSNLALVNLYVNDNSLTYLDASANGSVRRFRAGDNSLTYLNIANGNNSNFVVFEASGNPALTCIQVDSETYSNTNWTDIDGTASYSTNCPACVVNIPDATVKSLLVGNASINTNSNSEIECTEAAAFTGQLDLFGFPAIVDLTGIEAFTSITRLRCDNNSLTSLDLSQNTALTWLICSGNSLTELDLSNNLSLEQVRCNSNLLSNFDLSVHSNFTYLECNNNPISTLNVANGNNANISYFSATNNPNLMCIQVDNATASAGSPFWHEDATASYSENCQTVGISEATTETFSVYPNPAVNTLTIANSGTAIANITLINVTGKTVKTVAANTTTIDVSNLTSGVYFLQVQTEDKLMNTRFIKQ
ncbi:MAG: T9SS type A sorting domain-containing protein, partial [Flavobacteriales bacterium]